MGMKDSDLEALFARIRTWPPEWRQYTAGTLRSIEQMMALDGMRFLASEEEQAEILAEFADGGALAGPKAASDRSRRSR